MGAVVGSGLTAGPPSAGKPVKVAFAMRRGLPGQLFGSAELARVHAVAELDESVTIDDFGRADPRLLKGLDVLITGWDAPKVGPAELGAMPRLRAILHAAGSVKGYLTPEVWARGILVTTAADANARPVAEYTLAAILLAGKDVPALTTAYARDPGLRVIPGDQDGCDIGNYGRTVGIIGASRVGRHVIELLEPFDFHVRLYDPHIRPDDPIVRHVDRTGLVDLLRRSSIVSIHAPLLPETRGMLGSRELALMRPGSVLINTARGSIVDHGALVDAIRDGGLRAILDVTEPEPLPADHPLRELPGVILTPHVAGSLGNELRRLGQSVTTELELFAAGHPARSPVSEDALLTMA